MMNALMHRLCWLPPLVFALSSPQGAWAADGVRQTSSFYYSIPGDPRFRVDQRPIEDSRAELIRDAHGFDLVFDTRGLTDEHVFTVWLRVFNRPALCRGGEGVESTVCSRGEDIPPPPPPNPAPIADPCVPDEDGFSTCSVYWVGALLPGPDGRSHFSARIDRDQWRGFAIVGLDRAREGDGIKGLSNPFGAEVHVVLRDHGPMALPANPPITMAHPAGGARIFRYGDPETEGVDGFVPKATVLSLFRLGRQLTMIAGNCEAPPFFSDDTGLDDRPSAPGEGPDCFDLQLAFFAPPEPRKTE